MVWYSMVGHPIWTGMVIDSFTLRDTWTLEYKDRETGLLVNSQISRLSLGNCFLKSDLMWRGWWPQEKNASWPIVI